MWKTFVQEAAGQLTEVDSASAGGRLYRQGESTEPAAPALPGEVTLELSPHDLLIRSSQILHATMRNKTDHCRMMHHWRFIPSSIECHRHRFAECLSEDLLAHLSSDQRHVLRVDHNLPIHPRYEKEYVRLAGLGVQWGIPVSCAQHARM